MTQFNKQFGLLLSQWTDGPKYILAHPSAPSYIKRQSRMVGEISSMFRWLSVFDKRIGTVIIVHNTELPPSFEIFQHIDIRLVVL